MPPVKKTLPAALTPVKKTAKKVAPRPVRAVAPPAGIEVRMTRSRETKGTYVYEDSTEGTPIRALYISKGTTDQEPPLSIVVTILPA